MPLFLTLEDMARLSQWLTCYPQHSRRGFRYRIMPPLGVDLYRIKIAGIVLSEDDKWDQSRAGE